MSFAQSVNGTGGPTGSTPMMPLHMLINPTYHVCTAIRYMIFMIIHYYVQFHWNNTLE